MNKKKLLLIIIPIAIIIVLSIFVCFKLFINKNASNNTNTNSKDETISTNITKGGSYSYNGSIDPIVVDTDEEVTINLSGVSIANESGPAINVKNAKKVTIVLDGENTLNATVNEDEEDSCIYSNSDLEISGDGIINISSNLDGIVSKNNITIKSGTYKLETGDDGIKSKSIVTIDNGNYTINAKGDGVHADGYLEINDGTLDITAEEGLEATYIKINNGTINIKASDDGINASDKSSDYSILCEINGGNITIVMEQGDTDGIDSNGDLIINGGTINITCNSPFDYDGNATYNGGTIIANGQETNTITNQFMGGPQGGFDRR